MRVNKTSAPFSYLARRAPKTCRGVSPCTHGAVARIPSPPRVRPTVPSPGCKAQAALWRPVDSSRVRQHRCLEDCSSHAEVVLAVAPDAVGHILAPTAVCLIDPFPASSSSSGFYGLGPISIGRERPCRVHVAPVEEGRRVGGNRDRLFDRDCADPVGEQFGSSYPGHGRGS